MMDKGTYDKHTREIEHHSAFTSAFVNMTNGEDYISFRHGDKTLFTRDSGMDIISDGTPPGPPQVGDAYDIVLNYLAYDEERNKYSVTFTDTYSVTLDAFDKIRTDYARSAPSIVELGEKVITKEQIIQYDRLRDPEALVSEFENVKGMVTDFYLRRAEEALENAERQRIESAERSARIYNNPPRLRDIARTRGEALRTHREECALSDERYEEDKLAHDKCQLDVRFGTSAPTVAAAIDAHLRQGYPDLVERYENLPVSAKTPRHETMFDEYRHVRSELNGEAMKQLAAECTSRLEAASSLKIRLIQHGVEKPGIIESLRDPAEKAIWQMEEDILTDKHDYANNMMHVLWGHMRSGTDSEYVREIVDARLEAEHPRLFDYYVNKESVEHRVGDRYTRRPYLLEGMEFYKNQYHDIRNAVEEQAQKLNEHGAKYPTLAKTIVTLGMARRNWKKEDAAMERQLDALHCKECEARGVLAFGEYSPQALQYAADAMQHDPFKLKQDQEAMRYVHKWLENARSDKDKTKDPCFEYSILADRVAEEVMYSLAKEHSQAVAEYKSLLKDNHWLQDNQPGFLRKLLTNDGVAWSETIRTNTERMADFLNTTDGLQAEVRDGVDSPGIRNRVEEALHTLYRPAVERRDAALDVTWQKREEFRKNEETERMTAREKSPTPGHEEEMGPPSPGRADGGRLA